MAAGRPLAQLGRGRPHPLLFRHLRGQRRAHDGTGAGADPRHHPARHPESGARAARRCRPSYYARRSGVGLALPTPTRCSAPEPRIGVVGLGSGTLVLLRPARPELDLLRDRPGDGRRSRATASPSSAAARRRPGSCSATRGSACRASRANSIDILAVDAFSSDAVPMHLLTREALQRLRPRGAARRHRPLPHLQPLSRPQAGDRRHRRAAAAGPRRCCEYVPTERGGGAERHRLGLDRLVAQSGDDRPAGRAERRRRHQLGGRSSRGPASPAGPTTMPRSCRSSTIRACSACGGD